MIRKARQELSRNEAAHGHYSFLPALWAMAWLTLIALPSHAQPFQPVPDRVESVTRPAHAGDDASPFKPRRAGASTPPRSISIGRVSQEKISAETGAAPLAGMLPVHRFANNLAGGRFYTIYESEKNAVIQNYSWFKYDGIGFYAYPP